MSEKTQAMINCHNCNVPPQVSEHDERVRCLYVFYCPECKARYGSSYDRSVALKFWNDANFEALKRVQPITLQQPVVEGLTARAHVATLMLQGLLANPANREPLACRVSTAVRYADALLSALEARDER